MSNRFCPTCFIEVPASGVCDEHGIALVKTEKSVTAPERPVTIAQPKSSGDFLRTAREYLDSLGLQSVRVRWDQGKNRLGACHLFFGKPVEITFSRHMFQFMTDEEKWNTLTHEAAHALCPGDNHGWQWRQKHLELGGDGRRCSDVDVSMDAYKWVGTCPNGHTAGRHQRSAKMFAVSCVKCSPKWNPEFKFTWKQNF